MQKQRYKNKWPEWDTIKKNFKCANSCKKKIKNGKKYKNLSKKKAHFPFNISDIADAAVVYYNNDTNINDLNDIAPNKNTNAQIAIKKIVKKYRNLARKKSYQRPSKKTDDDVVILKQVPVHPRERLARKTKNDVKFVKQVPLHPQERLKWKRKSTTFDNYNHLSKKRKNEDVTFIKQVPLHPFKPLQRLAKID